MANSQKPDFEKILDWIEGKLPPEEAEAMAERMSSDGEARAEADWLRAFVRVSEETVMKSPPPEVRAELSRRFEDYAEKRRRPGLFQRVLASLTFDSGMQPAFGVRSARAAEVQRQYVYSTELADIALSLQPRPGGKIDLLGQVLPEGEEEPDEFTVQLLRSGVEAAETISADDLGEFAFEELEPGTYEMILATERYEILIPPFELR
jgi:hypothetical protein